MPNLRSYKDMMGFGGVCYTTPHVMKNVLERAESTDKEKIRKAIVETDMKMKQKGNILHYGVKFDEKGQNIHACELLNQIQGSQFLPIWPTDSAVAKPIWPFPGWKKRNRAETFEAYCIEQQGER